MKYFWIITFGLLGICSTTSLAQQEILWFPVNHRIVSNNSGNAKMQNASMIPYIMDEINQAFAPAGIQFYLGCPGIDTIRDNSVYNYSSYNASHVSSLNIPYTINIYYVNYANGMLGFYSNYNFIMVKNIMEFNYCGHQIRDSSTEMMGVITHELGHFFSLKHSFENYNNSLAEHPDRSGPRSNCTSRGDGFCDTPADVENSKSYGYYDVLNEVGNCRKCVLLKDSFLVNSYPHNGSGWVYKPDIKNYMGYAIPCYEHFSPQQLFEMRGCAERALGHNGCRGTYRGNPIFSYIRLRAGFSDGFDTLYAYNSDCDNIYPPPYTITHKGKDNKEKCLKEGTSIYFPPEMSMLDSAVWFINGDSVFAGTMKFASDSGDYYFPLWDFSPLWLNPSYNSNYITVEAKLPDGTSYTFKFRIGHCGDCEAIRVDLCCPCGFTPFGGNWPDIGIGGGTFVEFRYGIHICNADKNSIKDIRVTPLAFAHLFDSSKVDLETGKIDVFFTCDTDQPRSYTIPLEVCTDFEDGTTCCKNYRVEVSCGQEYYILPLFCIPNPVNDVADIGYQILGMQEGMPLKIYIYDAQGNLVLTVMNAIPTSATDTVRISTINLPSGHYYVVFKYGNQTATLPFIKQ